MRSENMKKIIVILLVMSLLLLVGCERKKSYEEQYDELSSEYDDIMTEYSSMERKLDTLSRKLSGPMSTLFEYFEDRTVDFYDAQEAYETLHHILVDFY
jgi:hypothetical protein